MFKIYFSFTFALKLVLVMDYPLQQIKRECRESRQQFPLL